MRQLVPILLSLAVSCSSLFCPSGYSDGGDGSCYYISPTSESRNKAYNFCANDGAYLYDVPNAFQNSGVQQRAGSASKVWLGLTCLYSSRTSCSWDYGSPINLTTYTNFNGGDPNVLLGACVYMDVRNGYWYSEGCSQVNMTFGCKYTPDRVVPFCRSHTNDEIATFDRQCYFPIYADSFDDAVSACRAQCGTVTSIHSPGENVFVNDIGSYYAEYYIYVYIGLQYGRANSDYNVRPAPTYDTPSYHWNDSSLVNYLQFGYENVQLGQCAAMALKPDLVKADLWINFDCGEALPAVCKRRLETECDRPTTVPPTQSPQECTSPYFYSGSGTIYSPGYPIDNSLNNSCEYLITDNTGQTVTLHFRHLSLNYYSKIVFFSGLADTTPFKTINYNNYYYSQDVYSPTNIIRMYYTTPGDSSAWVADYAPSALSTPQPTLPMTTTSFYPFCDLSAAKVDFIFVMDSSSGLTNEEYSKINGQISLIFDQLDFTNSRLILATYDQTANLWNSTFDSIKTKDDYRIHWIDVFLNGYNGLLGNNIDDFLAQIGNNVLAATPFRYGVRKVISFVSTIGWDRGIGFNDPTASMNAFKTMGAEFIPIAFGEGANSDQLSAFSSKCLQHANSADDFVKITNFMQWNLCQTTPQC